MRAPSTQLLPNTPHHQLPCAQGTRTLLRKPLRCQRSHPFLRPSSRGRNLVQEGAARPTTTTPSTMTVPRPALRSASNHLQHSTARLRACAQQQPLQHGCPPRSKPARPAHVCPIVEVKGPLGLGEGAAGADAWLAARHFARHFALDPTAQHLV